MTQYYNTIIIIICILHQKYSPIHINKHLEVPLIRSNGWNKIADRLNYINVRLYVTDLNSLDIHEDDVDIYAHLHF